MFSTIKTLKGRERYTFILHTGYSILDGIILGLLALNEFVFLKSLKGTDFQVGFLFQFSVVVLTFSIFFNEWLKKVRNKAKLLFKVGILTRFPMLLLVFFPKDTAIIVSSFYHYIFLFIFFLYYSAHPIIFPIINLLLKKNYSHERFGQLYSYATSLNKILMLIVTFLYGILLDYYPFAYTYALPIAAIMAIYSLWLLSRIPINEDDINSIKNNNFFSSIRNSLIEMKEIIKKNKAFSDFETGFMFYGFAFMGTVSVITIFFEKELHLNYSSIAFYKNIYNILAILLLPFFGKLLGKIDPRIFAALTYSFLLLYLFFIAISEFWNYHFTVNNLILYPSLLLAVFFNGFFAATMSLLWSIGSAYFCKKDEALHYQSIHLTFTGLRSFIAPFVGLWIYSLMGYLATFITGIIFLIIAILWMLNSVRKEKQTD